MASSDALVHGCEAETFCMVAAEARASGLPVIVPDRGGAADHANGMFDRHYHAADAGALREAMVTFADGRPYARSLQETTAVRTIDDHFRDLFEFYANVRSPNLLAA
jgi:alpha-1,6-mannosyltransferase